MNIYIHILVQHQSRIDFLVNSIESVGSVNREEFKVITTKVQVFYITYRLYSVVTVAVNLTLNSMHTYLLFQDKDQMWLH